MKNNLRAVALTAGAFLIIAASLLAMSAEARERQVPASREAIKSSFAPIVKKTLPAVVNVYVRHRTVRPGFSNPFFNDPFFRRFFGEGFGVPRERIQSSLGSGVIVDEKGLVVTNYHVIEGARRGEIKIALPNRREYQARIVLRDKRTDLAVLRIIAHGERFPFIGIANSDELEVGDLVLAMGNPFGVGQTVTSGIISALARTGIGDGDAQYFIQTDAAINPGNSGGALVDVDGRLVGINTAIFSKSGGSLGIGFAIPSNMVRLVVNSARKGSSVRRPWFGGNVKKVTPSIAEGLGLGKPQGVFVASLGDRSPARDAGLRVGDVIVAVNGHRIDDEKAFHYHFTINGVGGKAQLEILRDGRRFFRQIELARAPEIPPRNETRIRGSNPFSGAIVANLSPALAEELSMPDQSGVVIVGFARRSFARRLGLARRDVILDVNGVEIDSVADLRALLRHRASIWRFTIKRGDNILSMSLGG
jgi:Do/DeqQ family serine protease